MTTPAPEWLTREYIEKVRGWMQGMEYGDGESMDHDVNALCDMAKAALDAREALETINRWGNDEEPEAALGVTDIVRISAEALKGGRQ